MTVVVNAPAAAPTTDTSSFSDVTGRILQQLSLTAWLPAAFLIGNVGLVFAYRAADGSRSQRWRNIFSALDEKPFGILLAVLFALVLSTIVTQSLEFAAIRFLEGYWGTSWIAGQVASVGIWTQSWRQSRSTNAGERLRDRINNYLRPLLRQRFEDDPLAGRLALLLLEGHDVAGADSAALARAQSWVQTDAVQLVPARLAHRLSAIEVQSEAFPDPNRMMPSRLGVALRSGEDRLMGTNPRDALRGYVIANLDQISPLTLSEHDRYRNRLDMYAVLCVVAAATVPVDLLVLAGHVGWITLALLTAGGAMLSLVSYRGAVSSAVDYTIVLASIDQQVIASGRAT